MLRLVRSSSFDYVVSVHLPNPLALVVTTTGGAGEPRIGANPNLGRGIPWPRARQLTSQANQGINPGPGLNP